ELGEGVYEAELVAWLVKPGERVKRGQNLMEVLTDKATMEVPAPFSGTIDNLRAQPGQVIKVGDTVLAYSGASDKDGAKDGNQKKGKNNVGARKHAEVAALAQQTAVRPLARVPAFASGIKAAPSVRYLARKLGLNLAEIH